MMVHPTSSVNNPFKECPNGHVYPEEMAFIVDKSGSRVCRECAVSTRKRKYEDKGGTGRLP
jgi:hypothetical protein